MIEICLAREMGLSTRASSSGPDSVWSSDEVQEGFAVPTLIALNRVPARHFWIVAEDYADVIVKTSCVLRLSATEFCLPLLLPPKPVSIVADTLPEQEIGNPDIEQPFAKQARLFSTTPPVVSVWPPTFIMDQLSIIRDFVGCMDNDVEFPETEKEVRGYLRAKSVNARRE